MHLASPLVLLFLLTVMFKSSLTVASPTLKRLAIPATNHINISNATTSSNSTINHPPSNTDVAATAATSHDLSKWRLTYCNGNYDVSKPPYSCTGECHTWYYGRHIDEFQAPDTQCVYTYPPFEVSFKVCSKGYHCTMDTAFHPWLDTNGNSVYNAIDTDWIYINDS